MAYLKIGTVDEHYPAIPSIRVGDTQRTPSLFDLTGKRALVTGGNGGIGGGIARGLAEAGADIIIFQLPGEESSFSQELAGDTGRDVRVYECDLSSSEAIREVVPKLFADGLVVDILFNVAGISGAFVQVLDETDSHRELVAQLHYHAPYILSQLVGHHMAKRGLGGKIINISSVSALRPQTRFSTYGAMKMAVSHLTDSLADEFARYNIQVNDLIPGWIQTPLSQRMVDNKEFFDKTLSRIPAGRWGSPTDFKGVAVFLSSHASDYITGAHIPIDGGYKNM